MSRNKKIVFTVLISFLFIVGTIFAIDQYRMNNNLSVLFSTWGKDYSPRIKNIKYTSTGTAEYLFSLKNPYIGSLPEVVIDRLLGALDIRAYGHYTFELKDNNKPYTVVIKYSVVEGWGNILNNPQTVIEKSAIILALIDDVDEIHWILPDSDEIHKVTRNDLLAEYGSMNDYGISVDSFKQLLIKLDYYEESEPITMSIDTLTNAGLTLTVKNHTNNRYNYGEPYYLERFNNGWEKVDQIKDNCAFIMIGYTLKEKQQYKEEINWKHCYGKLPKGKYRITKDFTHIISEAESDLRLKFGKTHFISVEFLLE